MSADLPGGPPPPPFTGGRVCPSCDSPIPDGLESCEFCSTPPDVESFEGTDLDGRFKITEALGEGGMSVVYRGVQRSMGREVAIKLLRGSRMLDATATERFKREASLASQIRHPDAVTIYDFGQLENGVLYIAMELVKGRTLREVIQKDAPMDEVRAVRIARKAAELVGSAHEMGIVHRDLKPENIIVEPGLEEIDGRVTVLDFGISKTMDEVKLTRTGNLLGTPKYMSPEQCEGQPVDARSDVYSLGTILYEMLTGQPPFDSDGSNPVSLLLKQIKDPPRPMRSVVPTLVVSPDVERIVMRTLNKERERRPADGLVLARALDEVKARSGDHDPALRVASRSPRPGARTPATTPSRLTTPGRLATPSHTPGSGRVPTPGRPSRSHTPGRLEARRFEASELDAPEESSSSTRTIVLALLVGAAAGAAYLSVSGRWTGSTPEPRPAVSTPTARPATDPVPGAGSTGPQVENVLVSAEQALARNDLAEALELFEQAARLGPDDPQTELGLARTHRGLGNLEQAQAHYDRVIALVSDEPGWGQTRADARKERTEIGRIEKLRKQAQAYESQKRWDDAVERYRRITQLMPTASAYHDLGRTLAQANRRQEAAPFLERVVALEPDNGEAYFELGKVYFGMDRYREAADALERSLAIEHRPETLQYLRLARNRGGL